MDYFLVVWFAICPSFCTDITTDSADVYLINSIQIERPTYHVFDWENAKSLEECPVCNLAIFAKVKEVKKVIVSYIPDNCDEQGVNCLIVKKTEEISVIWERKNQNKEKK